jgi:transposase-like protein
MRKKRFTPQEKLQILLQGLRGDGTIAEVCRRYETSTPQFYRWKRQLYESTNSIFRRKNKHNSKEEAILRELNRMKNVITELTMENLELKRGSMDWETIQCSLRR